MDERNLSEEFNHRWELGDAADGAPEPVVHAMETARLLSQADYSSESQRRQETRRRLLDNFPPGELPGPRRVSGDRPRAGWVLPAVYLAAALVFILGLGWVIRNALPGGPPAISGLPAASSLDASATPFPTYTPQLTPEGFTPPETIPTPPVTLPPGYLTLQSLPGEIMQRVANPVWETLWLQGQATYQQPDGRQEKIIVQAWLGRDGKGLVLATDPLPIETSFVVDNRPGHAWIINDGQSIFEYDSVSQSLTPSQLPTRWSSHPLEGANPVMQMIFPQQPLPPSESLLPRELAVAAGRPVLVADWGDQRYWIDAETGMVIRRQSPTASGQTPVEVELQAVVVNPGMPDRVFDFSNPDRWAFELPPGSLVALSPTPTPTSYPTPGVGVPEIALALQDGLAEQAPSSEIYLLLTGSESPFTRQFVRVDAGCLVAADNCPAYRLPPVASQVQASLYWSPDGQQSVLLDSNAAELVAFDPLMEEWHTLLADFHPAKEPAIWSPDQAWIAFSLQSPQGDGSLATIARADGSELRTITPELVGQQDVIGWLGSDRLLVLHSLLTPKGQPGQESPPSLYSLDIVSGAATRLPFEESWLLVKSYPAPSPDGTRLALTQPGATGDELVIADRDGQILQRLGIDGGNPQWSPDGQWLAFVVAGGTGAVVYVTRPDGSELRPLFETSIYPPVLWAPDSRHLLIEDSIQISTNDPGHRELYLVSVQDGMARTLGIQPGDGSYEITNPTFRSIR